MNLSEKEICKECDLNLKRKDCTDLEYKECYERKYELIIFKKMLNSSVQRLGLEKEEMVKIIEELYI